MDAQALKADFPILATSVHGQPLTYLDSAATSQKPRAVIETVDRYYRTQNANVYRGVYSLAATATEAFEGARDVVARFLNAPRETIVFTHGTTDGLNLVAQSHARTTLGPGDEIVVSPLEHHANLVPWQEVSRATGARLRFVEPEPDGSVTVEAVRSALTDRTRLVALAHVSNVLGTVTDIARITRAVHERGARIVVDAAQSAPHMPVDVTALDVDFLAFSGHKTLGPTGIGVLYGKPELLAAMPPHYFGGEMIEEVQLEHSTYKPPPMRFEGGTPHIAGAIGLARGLEYLMDVGLEEIHRHEVELARYALERLAEVDGITVYGPRERQAGIITFNLGDVHPHDVATALDEYGVCVRAGHHCCQPLMHRLGIHSSARASFYLYTTREDIDRFVHALVRTREFFLHAVG